MNCKEKLIHSYCDMILLYFINHTDLNPTIRCHITKFLKFSKYNRFDMLIFLNQIFVININLITHKIHIELLNKDCKRYNKISYHDRIWGNNLSVTMSLGEFLNYHINYIKFDKLERVMFEFI